jgi:hypothetical protein
VQDELHIAQRGPKSKHDGPTTASKIPDLDHERHGGVARGAPGEQSSPATLLGQFFADSNRKVLKHSFMGIS